MSTPRRPAPRSSGAPITATVCAGFSACTAGKGSSCVGVPAPIRVLIADDDEGYLESLEALIERQPELTVVAVARDGQEAVDLAAALDPEAVVIDLHMPRVDGVQAVNRLRSEHP